MESLMSFPAVFQEGKKQNATYYSGGGSAYTAAGHQKPRSRMSAHFKPQQDLQAMTTTVVFIFIVFIL